MVSRPQSLFHLYRQLFLSFKAWREQQQIPSVQMQPINCSALGKPPVVASVAKGLEGCSFPSCLHSSTSSSQGWLNCAVSGPGEEMHIGAGAHKVKSVWLGEGQAMDYSIQTCPAVLRVPPNCLNPLKLCSCEECNISAPKTGTQVHQLLPWARQSMAGQSTSFTWRLQQGSMKEQAGGREEG